MLRIGIAEYQQLRRHGEETYPDECCGILLGAYSGDARVVLATVPCANASANSPRHRYSIDSREVIRAQRNARDRGLEIVGFYHSHPDHPPQWSSTDLQEAHWVGCSYVITRVEQGIAAETKSFLLAGKLEEDKSFVDEDLVIQEAST
jgi:proteasome lid subunit RPN8/RPN11